MLNSPLYELARRAETDRDRLLLVDGSVSLTFGQVHANALALGTWLRSTGFKKGDRIGILMSKSSTQVLAIFGCLAAGTVFVPISDLLKPDQVQHIVDDCGICAVIADHDKVDRLGDLAAGIRILTSGGERNELEGIFKSGLLVHDIAVIGQDTAAIIYTSGSTGMPKGIVLSHRNLWDGSRIVSNYLGLNRDDRLAQVLSLNFDYGLNQVFSAVLVGAEVHLATFHFPKDLFFFLKTHKITTLALMPVFLNRLFDPRFFQPSFVEGLTALRRITTSGGRMPSATIRAIRTSLPSVELYLMYGLTEAFRSTYLPPAYVDIYPDSIGRAIPDVQIMVLDENDREVGPDQSGELVHRGGVIAKGYWNAPEKTAERFKPWLDPSGNIEIVVRSGDIVRRNAQGFLFFVGRRDNQIKTSGHRVSPEEIERAAEQLPGIRHAVAFGRENDVLGEEIVLVVISDAENPLPDLLSVRAHLREKLAAYMVPLHIVAQDSFEVTPGNQGKVDRKAAERRALESLAKAGK